MRNNIVTLKLANPENILREWTLSEPDEKGNRSIDTITFFDPTKRVLNLKNKSL